MTTSLKDVDDRAAPDSKGEVITQGGVGPLAVCRWTNARASGSCYVHVEYAYGGYTNFVLSRPGDWHELHVRSSAPWDRYCWSKTGGINSCNGSYDVSPGQNRRMVD